jgi:hypothetical protein
MKRLISVFLLALLVGATWVARAHAHASYGGDCRQCHSFSNQLPVANAGVDKTVTAGAAVTLSGSASSDPDDGIASYAWAQIAGTTVALTNANTVTASFTAPNVTASMVLTFRLTVTDRRPQTATDTINVTVNPAATNRPPTANAGADQTVTAGAGVTLSGAASSDPDDGIGSYAWAQTAGTAVTLANASTVSATFTAPNATASTTLTFQLTVRDRANQAATDTIVVTVNPVTTNRPPTANAGPDQTVTAGATVALSGAASTDPDDGIASYAWSQTGGTAVSLANPGAQASTFTAPGVTTSTVLTFQLTVRDRANQAANDTIAVTVNPAAPNAPPVANAGLDQTVIPGTFVTLDGFSASDPENGIASYAWEQIGGPTVTLSNPAAMNPIFQAPYEPGPLTFQLVVTDKGGLQTTDIATVTVLPPDAGPPPAPVNRPPVANAGADKAATAGTAVTLSGAASSDPDDGIASYAWTQTGGAAVTLANANSVSATFTAPNVTTSTPLTFQLTVRDRANQAATDTVVVTVNPTTVNRPPVANAGPDKTVRSRSTVRLSGSASTDPDDGIASYQWTQTAGVSVRLTGASTVNVSFVAPRTTSRSVSLTFRLTVRDRAGQSSSDTVTVRVSRSSSSDD